MSWLESVKHFSPTGDPGLNDPTGERMSPELMALLDAMREEAGVPFHASAGFREQARQDALLTAGLTETSGGAHPLGKAVDGYFVGLPLLAMFCYACRWPFAGIGLYPYTSNDQPVLHLDVMERGRGRTALWIRGRLGKYIYAPSPRFVEELQMLVAAERWGR